MKKFYAILTGTFITCAAFAQPAGWSYVQPLQVQNNTASLVTNYQLQFTYNTSTPIGAGQMNVNGNDIRFGKDCAGTTLFNYWIESGINTASTTFWVKIDSLPASGLIQFYMFYGNASAPAASAVMGTFIGPHSSTDSVASGGAGGVAQSQRGFRFSPNENVLMTHAGKRDPTGTVRYVTLFDFATQAIISQQQVGGPAGQYSYNPLPNPIWLIQGTQYTLQLFQGTGDGYYFGTSSQIGQHLTYLDMRYCNSCTQNTFPTNTLTNYHYGYPDMWYFTKQTIATAPTVSPGSIGSGTLVTGTSGLNNVCPGDSAMVSIAASGGTGSYSYQWLPTTGMANANSASTMVLPPTSGMYYCMVSDACGNAGLDSIYVTIYTPPTVTASVSTDSVCAGASFIPMGGGAISYSWSGGLTDMVAFTPSATNNYTVTGTDANGCTNIAVAAVEVLPLPSVTASASDSTVCAGDAVTFNGGGAATYTWDNGVTDNVAGPATMSAMYHVTGADIYGCVNWDSIYVTVNALPNVIGNVSGAPICVGGTVNLSASGADVFVWNPGSLTGSSVNVTPSSTTTYTVTGTDSLTGCSNVDSVIADVNQNPFIVTTSDTSCSNICGQLNAVVTGGSPGYTYMWVPTIGLNNTAIANPVSCMTITQCYTVMVTDANGCTDAQLACNNVNTAPTVALTGPANMCVTDATTPVVGTPGGGSYSGPGITGNSFSPGAAGVGTHAIVYSFTDSSGCDAADTISIVVSPCVGIADNNANDGIDVFPNPFESELIVKLDVASRVRMFNELGQVVIDQQMNAGRNTINTGALSSGVYFLEVVSATNSVTLKIVKSN